MLELIIGETNDFNKTLAKNLNIEFVPVEKRRHKDGELTPRTLIDKSKVKNKEVLLCMRKGPRGNPNNYIINYILEAASLKKSGAEVTAVMPYLPYARQDKEFVSESKFEPISIEILLETLSPYVNELITFNAHFERKEKIITDYTLPIHNIDAFKLIGQKIPELPNPMIIAPDKGMRNFAKELAGEYNCSFDYLEKERDVNTGKITFKNKNFRTRGKNIIIPDDMVSTAGTLIQGIKHIKQRGNPEVYPMFVHGAFTHGAYHKLDQSCTAMIYTDTVTQLGATHSVVNPLSQYIRETFK